MKRVREGEEAPPPPAQVRRIEAPAWFERMILADKQYETEWWAVRMQRSGELAAQWLAFWKAFAPTSPSVIPNLPECRPVRILNERRGLDVLTHAGHSKG